MYEQMWGDILLEVGEGRMHQKCQREAQDGPWPDTKCLLKDDRYLLEQRLVRELTGLLDHGQGAHLEGGPPST